MMLAPPVLAVTVHPAWSWPTSVFSQAPNGQRAASTRPVASLSRWCSRVRVGMDASVLLPPGAPSPRCGGVHCVWCLAAALPQSLND
jgi:hypothetical protein